MKTTTESPASEHEHTPDAIRARLAGGSRINYLRDFVYGGIDGAVVPLGGPAPALLAGSVVLAVQIESKEYASEKSGD